MYRMTTDEITDEQDAVLQRIDQMIAEQTASERPHQVPRG